MDPLVSEMVFSNGDLSLLDNVKKIYQNYDFSSFDEFEHPAIW